MDEGRMRHGTSDEQDRYYDGILRDKYAKGTERSVPEVLRRVARGLAAAEPKGERGRWESAFFKAMEGGFYPAGRIMSAAGAGISATLINCFVQPVGDSVSAVVDGKAGIYTALLQAAETMRRGGGVGYDFSAIRPRGAVVRSSGSRASGPVSYMRVFDRSCETVESAGARRGAQMGVMRVDHPDIEEFVRAKDIRLQARRLREAGFEGPELEGLLQKLRTLSNFNISVAVTDEFMRLKGSGGMIELTHAAEPDRAEFPQAYRRDDGRWVYKRLPAAELWDLILRTTYETADPGVVFIDRMNAENNLAYCERIEATNPCGEQPLPDYGCCCLGSINLALFVAKPFSPAAQLDWKRLEQTAATAVRMLDNVLDISPWPLPEQAREAASKRRIGLGFTGLGTALLMLRIRYGSDGAVKLAQRLARSLRDSAYRASVALARERGAFPLFDAQRYLASPFVQRLPQPLRTQIARHGIRNSHLLSIAPTGTISLAFGRNVTGGIEPAFAWEYTRRTRNKAGQTLEYPVQDYGYRQYLEAHAGGKLPPYFVSAQTLQPLDHLRIQAAVQPYVDSSISKTVNVPLECSFEAFKDIYDKAYEWGCKGCTTYRPNDVTGAVLSLGAAPAPRQAPTLALDLNGSDRRLRLQKLPAPPLASLKWPGRPEFTHGNPAWTYMVDAGPGCRFAVFVGHTETGDRFPFEVWVNGAEQPRGLGATAKLLSMDLRSRDRAWIRLKLENLIKIHGNPVTVALPPDGRETLMASPTAVLARLVLFRCKELGLFEKIDATPVVDALISAEEPATGTEGTMSWTVDVKNPSTGENCSLVLKELQMPDGQRRPYAMGLYGEYPRDLDGLCGLLSLDMRVIDPGWIGAKLQKLLNFPETGASFLGRIPGQDKGQLYPSTVSYLAALMLHRYQMLGILGPDGLPLRPLGLLERPAAPEGRGQAVLGAPCPECGAHAVVKREGCQACTSCGWIGNCG